jgi:hypothetical protein
MLGIAVQDHPFMQATNSLAAGGLKQAGDEPMNNAGTGCTQHLEAETESHAQMFKIAFADTLWMLDKQFLEHGCYLPV